LIDLLDNPKLDETDISSLNNIIYGTELMPAPKLEEALHRFGPILQQGYGSAEVLPPVAMLTTKNHVLEDGKTLAPRNILNSVGKMVPQVQVIITDENDNALPTGQKGNILIKSPTQFKGYLKNQEMNEKVLKGGWLHIGDMGYIDSEGYLHVLGRKPDLIVRNNHTTYPRLVEEVMHDHEAVKETSYVQVGDKAIMALSLRGKFKNKLGEDKVAMEEELFKFISGKVPVEDMPDGIHLFNELPRSQLAKVLRREVRQFLSQ